MKTLTTLLMLFSTLLGIVACGGGGSSNSAQTTPTLVAYQNFDLRLSIPLAQPIGCPTNTNQLVMNYYYTVPTQIQGGIQNVVTGITTNLSGNINLPNGALPTCTTTGINGTITQVVISNSQGTIYTLSNLNIPASSVSVNWEGFWTAVLAQTGSINISQTSSAIITCTNLNNQTYSQSTNALGNVAPFFNHCL